MIANNENIKNDYNRNKQNAGCLSLLWIITEIPVFILKANENAVKSMPYDVPLSNMNILLIVSKISHILYYCESLAGLISPSSCKTGNSNFIQC